VREHRRLLRGGMVLSGGSALSQVLSLVRNLIVARLVTPEDFGVAVTFAVTLSILEAAFAHGFEKLLIQDSEGEDETLQSMLQTILVGRGFLVAALIFFSASWIAHLFSIPDATFAYQLLALVPLIRGFAHLDVKRVQRELRFAPDLGVQLLSQLVGVVVAASYAWVSGNYWAMLWGILAQVTVQTVLTHVVAVRRFRLGWRQEYTRRVLGFSWPLMLNGLVLILSSQGDRLLVGARLSVADLAIYSAAAMLLTAGLMFLAKVAGELSLPWLSAVKHDKDRYLRRHSVVGAAVATASVAVFGPLAVIGMDITRLIFGARYGGPDALVAWLALAMGLRFFRVWPIVTAMSFGDTRNLMVSNLVRGLGVFGAYFLIISGAGLVGVAAAAAIAEGLATFVAFFRLRRVARGMLAPSGFWLVFVAVSFAASMAVALMVDAQAARIAYTVSVVPVSLGVMLWFEPRLLGIFRRGG